MGLFRRQKQEGAQPPVRSLSQADAVQGQRRAQSRPQGRLPARAGARLFDGSRIDRLTADWTATPAKADTIIRQHQRVLVARAREQVRNNDYARAFVRLARTHVAGPRGVLLQAQSRGDDGRFDTLANAAIEEAFALWGRRESCDVAGLKSWRALQAAAVASAVVDGEFMFRMIFGADAGPFGFALQMLDPQRCNPQHDEDDLPGGRFIRAGIEFNQYGRPLTYHFADDQGEDAYGYSHSRRDSLRVPAAEIIHGFLPEFVGQKRGLPWMATGLFRMRQLAGFEDAAVVNARVGASKMGALQWRDGFGPEYDEDAALHMPLETEPGEFMFLPAGAELREWAPQFPANEFASFNKAMLRGIAAGFGVLYNNLANDLEGVNFSSIRQGTLDEREWWKELQEWLIESLVQPVFDAWLPRALLGGHIRVKGKTLKPERLARYAQVAWQPRRWAWIDPQSDIQAAVAAKNQLLMSPGQIIREQGRDPSDVWREIASDIQEMRDAGIPEEFIKSAVFDKNLQAAVMAETAKQARPRAGNQEESADAGNA